MTTMVELPGWMVSSGTKMLVRGWTSLIDVTVADTSPACDIDALPAPVADVDEVNDTAVDIFASWFNGILLAALKP